MLAQTFGAGNITDSYLTALNIPDILFSMNFIATNGLISSFLVASGNVYISGLVSIPFNIFVIVAIFLGSMTNSYVMVYGTLFAYVAQLLFQIPFLFKKGYKHKFVLSLKDENIKQMLYPVVPVFLGSYVNTVVNRTLASTLESGSIPALNYANKLNVFV